MADRNGRLEGKVAVITGAARGVGRACAVLFATEGADLVLVDAPGTIDAVGYPLGTASQLDHTAEKCREQGADVMTADADVRDLAALENVARAADDRYGRVDVLVNCAGVAGPSGHPVHETSVEDWQLMLDINLSGPWRTTKVFAGAMAARRSGAIVHVASTAALVGYRHFAGYVAAKHGLVGLTRASALDYAPFKVRVNAVCPGNIRDDPAVEGRMLSEVARALDVPLTDYEALFTEQQPMNTLVEPTDVAEAALWFASDASSRVTGSVLTVDAGYVIR